MADIADSAPAESKPQLVENVAKLISSGVLDRVSLEGGVVTYPNVEPPADPWGTPVDRLDIFVRDIETAVGPVATAELPPSPH